jgi:GNAT superfamily N-acetyltransferase
MSVRHRTNRVACFNHLIDIFTAGIEAALYEEIKSGSVSSANFHAVLYRSDYETTHSPRKTDRRGKRKRGGIHSGSCRDMGHTASDFAGNRLMTTEEAVSFRLATDDDREYVYESVLENLANTQRASDEALSWSDFLLSWHATSNYLVYIGDQKAGLVRWERGPDAMHLTDLFLATPFRRRGAGSIALEFFEKYALSQGFKKVSLVAYIADRVSMHLAEKRGYGIEKRDEQHAHMVKRTAP